MLNLEIDEYLESGLSMEDVLMDLIASRGLIYYRDMVNILIERGVNLDGALAISFRNRVAEEVRFFINKGANQFEAASILAKEGYEQAINYLSKLRFDLDGVLYLVAKEGHDQAADLLIRQGANIARVFLQCVHRNEVDTAKFLVKKGADIYSSWVSLMEVLLSQEERSNLEGSFDKLKDFFIALGVDVNILFVKTCLENRYFMDYFAIEDIDVNIVLVQIAEHYSPYFIDGDIPMMDKFISIMDEICDCSPDIVGMLTIALDLNLRGALFVIIRDASDYDINEVILLLNQKNNNTQSMSLLDEVLTMCNRKNVVESAVTSMDVDDNSSVNSSSQDDDHEQDEKISGKKRSLEDSREEDLDEEQSHDGNDSSQPKKISKVSVGSSNEVSKRSEFKYEDSSEEQEHNSKGNEKFNSENSEIILNEFEYKSKKHQAEIDRLRKEVKSLKEKISQEMEKDPSLEFIDTKNADLIDELFLTKKNHQIEHSNSNDNTSMYQYLYDKLYEFILNGALYISSNQLSDSNLYLPIMNHFDDGLPKLSGDVLPGIFGIVE